MKTYRRLENPKLYATIRTQILNDDGTLSDGALIAPGTTQIIIEDSTGVVVQVLADVFLYEGTAGKYYYMDYTIPANANLGVWHYEVRGTTTGKTAIFKGSFLVEAQVD